MIVLDASIIFKWFDKYEPHRKKANILLEKHLSHHEEIIAPYFLLYEIANAWSTKQNFPVEKIIRNIDLLQTYNLLLISADFEQIKSACEFSKRYAVTVYDASYAVLAQEKQCNLITADEQFVKKVKLPFIQLLKETG